MTQEDFLNAVNKNVERVHQYELGHDGSDGKCDCIGQIIGAVRLAGEKWPWTHGSNYSARYRTGGQRYVSKASEQSLGDQVYKARNPGDERYDLPSTYKNHSDQRDYYHVGVVTNIAPFEITHCTSVAGGIKRDNSLGAWHYAGQLNQIEKGGNTMPVDYNAIVTADNGSTVNLRQGPSTKAAIQKVVKVGTLAKVVEEYNDEWAKVNVDGTIGYMMRKFLKEEAHPVMDTVTIALDYNVALALFAALQSVVKE